MLIPSDIPMVHSLVNPCDMLSVNMGIFPWNAILSWMGIMIIHELFLGVQNFETCAAKSGCKRCVRTATCRSLMLGAVLFFGAVGELAQREDLLG
jgi:hypothetical protein